MMKYMIAFLVGVSLAVLALLTDTRLWVLVIAVAIVYVPLMWQRRT